MQLEGYVARHRRFQQYPRGFRGTAVISKINEFPLSERSREWAAFGRAAMAADSEPNAQINYKTNFVRLTTQLSGAR